MKGVRSQSEGVAFIDLLQPCPLLVTSKDHLKSVVVLSIGVVTVNGAISVTLGQEDIAPHFAYLGPKRQAVPFHASVVIFHGYLPRQPSQGTVVHDEIPRLTKETDFGV